MTGKMRILTLDLGSHTIGLAEFVRSPDGGLALNAYRRREIPGDAPDESARNADITALLREMMREMHIKHAPVNYAIAAQLIFARFVKLPAVEEEKVERIVAFEAQQNVPFPIDEVVWDYQLVAGGADEQIQVVLFATKADLLDGINQAVEEAGLKTNIVGVATGALYNAFRYNYEDLTGCSLLIDIGARTTNLLFIEPGKIFSRSVAIGGGTITSAIAREFHEPLAAAELRKRRDGVVGLGDNALASDEPDVERMAKIIRSTMARLHAEVMRSISHYRSQQQGGAPERIFLCGGSASTPHMREFFQEKLQLPVEFFNPLRNVSLAPALDPGETAASAHLLGELVGLALRSLTTCPLEVNLRPASVVRRQQLERRLPFLVAAAVCIILGIIARGAFDARSATLFQHEAAQLDQRIATMRQVETQIAVVRKQVSALETSAAPLVSAINDRSFWPEILEDLNSRLPKEDIWITELVAMTGGKPLPVRETTGGAPADPLASPSPAVAQKRATTSGPAMDGILVRGLYLFNPKQQEVVVDYFRNLIGSPYFVIDAGNQAKVMKPSTPNNTEWAFPYELRLDLRKPLPLP